MNIEEFSSKCMIKNMIMKFRYFAMLSKNYDPEFGGYSRAPKFPQPSNLKTMFRYSNCTIIFS